MLIMIYNTILYWCQPIDSQCSADWPLWFLLLLEDTLSDNHQQGLLLTHTEGNKACLEHTKRLQLEREREMFLLGLNEGG